MRISAVAQAATASVSLPRLIIGSLTLEKRVLNSVNRAAVFVGVAPPVTAARLDVSYWVTTSQSDRTLLLAFSTALLEHREAVVEVGDAIVGTLDWQAEGPA